MITIRETGKMHPKYQKDDDIKTLSVDEYIKTEYSIWKRNSSIVQELLEQVFKEYPGDIEEDMTNDLEKVKIIQINIFTLNIQYLYNVYYFFVLLLTTLRIASNLNVFARSSIINAG